jgi:quercetin dioxygenase-like cupin family protein
MPVERAADHPTFEIGGNAVTSFAAPARGAEEAALFQIELPAGGGLPPHRHDHFDVFTVTAGGGTVFLGDEAATLAAGDSCVVPPDQLHWVEAGPDGATIVVTMLAGTKLIREDDGTVLVPPWVS